MKLLFTFILLSSICFGQSKKDQIEALNKSIDSLNTVLATTRDNSAKDISSLNDKIKEVTDEVTALKSELNTLQSSNNKLTKENEKFKTDLVELSKENEKFKTDLGELSKKNLELEAKLETTSPSTDSKKNNASTGDLDKVAFKSHNPCAFSVSLPTTFKLVSQNYETSPDWCDYEVKLTDGSVIIQINSLLNSRFLFDDIKEGESYIKYLYRVALSKSRLDITV